MERDSDSEGTVEGEEGDDSDFTVTVTGAIAILDLNVLPPPDSIEFLEFFNEAKTTVHLKQQLLRMEMEILESKAETAKLKAKTAKFNAEIANLKKEKLRDLIRLAKAKKTLDLIRELKANDEKAKLEVKLKEIGDGDDRREEREEAIQESRKTIGKIWEEGKDIEEMIRVTIEEEGEGYPDVE